LTSVTCGITSHCLLDALDEVFGLEGSSFVVDGNSFDNSSPAVWPIRFDLGRGGRGDGDFTFERKKSSCITDTVSFVVTPVGQEVEARLDVFIIILGVPIEDRHMTVNLVNVEVGSIIRQTIVAGNPDGSGSVHTSVNKSLPRLDGRWVLGSVAKDLANPQAFSPRRFTADKDTAVLAKLAVISIDDVQLAERSIQHPIHQSVRLLLREDRRVPIVGIGTSDVERALTLQLSIGYVDI